MKQDIEEGSGYLGAKYLIGFCFLMLFASLFIVVLGVRHSRVAERYMTLKNVSPGQERLSCFPMFNAWGTVLCTVTGKASQRSYLCNAYNPVSCVETGKIAP